MMVSPGVQVMMAWGLIWCPFLEVLEPLITPVAVPTVATQAAAIPAPVATGIEKC